MTLRRKPTRPSSWALAAFVAALVLRAAMPFLATASADLQGRTLVEVCTVYGVSLLPLHGEHHEPFPGHGPDHASGHLDEHCALTALAVMGGTAPPPASLPRAAPVPLLVVDTGTAGHPRDAEAAWIAGRKHGPPATS